MRDVGDAEARTVRGRSACLALIGSCIRGSGLASVTPWRGTGVEEDAGVGQTLSTSACDDVPVAAPLLTSSLPSVCGHWLLVLYYNQLHLVSAFVCRPAIVGQDPATATQARRRCS